MTVNNVVLKTENDRKHMLAITNQSQRFLGPVIKIKYFLHSQHDNNYAHIIPV